MVKSNNRERNEGTKFVDSPTRPSDASAIEVFVGNQSGDPLPVSLTPAAVTPTIYNVSAAVSGTEYSQALSASTKKFTIRVRGNANLQVAFTSGQTNINFITVRKGSVLSEDNINSTITLYFETDQNSQTVEILEWA